MNTFFVRLPQCGGKNLFLLTHLKDEGKGGFDLTLTDGDSFWEGQLTEKDLDSLNSNLKMDFSTYVSQTVTAFTRCDMADVNFVYQLKQLADGAVDFSWKKEVGDIKIRMGSVTLHQQNGTAKALTHLFTSCIDMAAERQSKIRTLEADNQRLAQERKNALERLEKCVHVKEELEQDLYSKFAAVLNSKKRMIRSLQEGRGDAETLEDEPVPSTSDGAANSKKSGRRPSPPPEAASEAAGSSSNEDEDRDTDDETPPRKRHAPVHKVAGTDADSSLILSDDDDDKDKVKGVVKRPARQRGGSKRQTPAKPVLPKVSLQSSGSGTKTPQRGSLRKSGSGNSDRSADNLDTDDLLNDF